MSDRFDGSGRPPWRETNDGALLDGDGKPVGAITRAYAADPVTPANRALIVAAPELLRHLRRVLEAKSAAEIAESLAAARAFLEGGDEEVQR
jgi:hypothetical protein